MREKISCVIIISALLAFGNNGCQSHQEGHSPASGPDQITSSQERARCPVCNMYADMDPAWVAQIDYVDGSKLMFDTPHHLFKFYLNPSDAHQLSEYHRSHRNISKLSVTDYKTKTMIDARTSFYLIGSDIKSIMGDTFVPFGSKAEAQEGEKEHGGRILAFGEVTRDLLTGLM